MTTKERIINLLNDKIDDIFFEMQNELNIENGDVFPLDKFKLDNCIENLAETINVILDSQKEG